jgi:hypothetical protein
MHCVKEKFREMRDAYLEIWSKNLIETVNSDGYAKASGAALDGYLAIAAPFKEPTEKAMLNMLHQLNMPTSADFMGLSGRFTNVELLLDNIDAKLDRIEKLLAAGKPAVSAEAKVPNVARKTTPKKQTALRAAATSKRTATAKPVRRNPRKVTR